MFLLTTAAFLVTFFSTRQAMVFVQQTADLSITPHFPAGADIYHVVVIDEVTGRKPEDVTFHISSADSTPFLPAKSIHSLFAVDRHVGTVLLAPHQINSLADFKGYTFHLEVVAAPGRPSNTNHSMKVTITVYNDTEDGNEEDMCKPRKELCFSSSTYFFLVPESTESGAIIGRMKPLNRGFMCPEVSSLYDLLPEGNPVSIRETTGELELTQRLDYETKKRYIFNVSCRITHAIERTSVSAIFTKKAVLKVKDVDDNAPHSQNKKETTIEIDSFDIKPGKELPIQVSVLDADSPASNDVTISLDDPLNLVRARDPDIFPNVNEKRETLINTALYARKPFAFPGTSYAFAVTFEDKGLITKENNKVVFHVKIYNSSLEVTNSTDVSPDFQFAVNISRHAGHHARVMQPIEAREVDHFSFHLSHDELSDSGKIFGATLKTGIIYVKDAFALLMSQEENYRLNLTWRKRNRDESKERTCVVFISVLEDNDIPKNGCIVDAGGGYQSCSVNGAESTCVSSCGRGSTDGLCQWRRHHTTAAANLTSHYATCSPQLNTCPDGRCDELEEYDSAICPQDCASSVNGAGIMSHLDKGIYMAAAPCTCDGRDTCTCVSSYAELPKPTKRIGARERQRRKGDFHSKTLTNDGSEGDHKVEKRNVCDTVCVTIIAGIAVVVSTLVSVAAFAVFRHVRGTQSDKHKYVANRVPLTTVVSDYVDDRIQPTLTTEASNEPTAQDKCLFDPKWEFRRDRLILQENLGEGEFGKVVKAQAWNIAQRPGYTTVAVKTLKENGTASEEQDLLSELSLLREVSHPNVIQLLGACTTKGGPLYIIVEFAELGSLRSYLRKMRNLDGAVAGRSVVDNPSYFAGGITDNQVQFNRYVQQELLSFAWQTAKGMTYLSDMKLVHRDLAARNILLAQNKVVKISDFGLSRDVYEGDTYLKTTKGRVPVKWMAIESLEDHVYTIKSDVWSYGIVLWEIVTLGATPYPGITPERLYHLLKEGYRMPQPDNCPPKLYKIMRKCWRDMPHERPCFKELVENVDRLLQDTVEYLPLGPAEINAFPFSSHYEKPLISSQQMDEGCENACSVQQEHCSRKTASKVNKTHIPASLHFTKADEPEYESRQLLPASPADTSCGTSG